MFSMDRSKGLLFLNYLLIISVIVSAFLKAPPKGYEISVYDGLGLFTWYIIALSFIIIVLYIVFFGVSNYVHIFSQAIVLIFIVNSFPILRGYYAYGGGDMTTHIGRITDIIRFSNLGPSHFDPGLHLEAATLSIMTSIEVKYIALLVAVFLYTNYVLFTYLFCREFLSRKTSSFILSIAIIPLFGSTTNQFMPYIMTFYTLPMALYTSTRYYNNTTNRNLLSLYIVILAIVFSHAMTSLITIFVVTGWGVYYYASVEDLKINHLLKMSSVFFASAIVYFMWYFSFRRFTISLERLISTILMGSGDSTVEQYTQTVQSFPLSTFDLLKVFTLRYGQVAVLATISSVIIVYYINKMAREDKISNATSNSGFVMFFLLLFIFSCVLSLSFLIFDLRLTWSRYLQYVLFSGTLLTGIGFAQLSNQLNRETSAKLLYVSVIVIVLIISLFSLYASPYVISSSNHITEMEAKGSDWFFTHSGDNIPAQELGTDQDRLLDFKRGDRAYQPNIRSHDTGVPEHFNYDSADNLSQSYESQRYLLLMEMIIIYYPEVHPDYEENWAYNPNDFEKLNYDNSNNRLYHNGEYYVYLIS